MSTNDLGSHDGLDSPRVNVLDHGYVELAYWSPQDDWVKAVADAARVSVLHGKRRKSDLELVESLIRRKHVSTLEHCTLTMVVKLPIFVARQWMRHRSWSFNEVSGRYSKLDAEVYIPALERIGPQHATEGQGTAGTSDWTDEKRQQARDIFTIFSNGSFDGYAELLELGVSKELARLVLPVNTYTAFRATVNLRDLIFFLCQRLDPHAQYEIQQYAKAILWLLSTRVSPAMGAIVDRFVAEQIKGGQG